MPEASFAEQVTVVSPIGNEEPEAREHVTGAAPQLSVAEVAKVAVAPLAEHVWTLTGWVGQWSTGGWASTTVTWPTHCALAAPSEAVSVRAGPRPWGVDGASETDSGEGPWSGS